MAKSSSSARGVYLEFGIWDCAFFVFVFAIRVFGVSLATG